MDVKPVFTSSGGFLISNLFKLLVLGRPYIVGIELDDLIYEFVAARYRRNESKEYNLKEPFAARTNKFKQILQKSI